MPELPDVELYIGLLREKLVGRTLTGIKLFNPFVLRSVSPKPLDLVGLAVVGLRRIGKRVVIEFPEERFLVIHLMIAGRFRWVEGGSEDVRLGGKISMAAMTFENGALFLTEAGTKKRASIAVVQGESALSEHDPGGIDVLNCSLEQFGKALLAESQTVKKRLTDPHVFSGIGNAYSDEILHAARISPVRRSNSLTPEEIKRLHSAMGCVLRDWVDRLQRQFAGKFPGAGDITAFRPEFAVHGKFGRPCPVCGRPVQRICYADNESNYCAQCQNDGRILADRALSRLLKDDWPRSFD
ncbi:MAG: DNA-formamidopyrimidine glycosylase family protein [Fimbriimonas sp.]|nr:DNA-formamidopyrimidine glycosylase family protein [Fimbriimonas sp.]